MRDNQFNLEFPIHLKWISLLGVWEEAGEEPSGHRKTVQTPHREAPRPGVEPTTVRPQRETPHRRVDQQFEAAAFTSPPPLPPRRHDSLPACKASGSVGLDEAPGIGGTSSFTDPRFALVTPRYRAQDTAAGSWRHVTASLLWLHTRAARRGRRTASSMT